MHDLTTYKLNQERQKVQRQFADTYRLSQSLDEHNKTKFDWRDLMNPFNRSRN